MECSRRSADKPSRAPKRHPSAGSISELKTLEAVQFFLDAALQFLARPLANPIPFLQQQFSVLAVGLQIDRGDDIISHQHRQREIAEHPLLLRHIGLEAMAVAEEQFGSLALDDEGIERREDVDHP